jgi:hypothetical protein
MPGTGLGCAVTGGGPVRGVVLDLEGSVVATPARCGLDVLLEDLF